MQSKHRRRIAGAALGALVLSLVLLLTFDLSPGGKSSPRYYSGSAGYGLILFSPESGPMENALLDLASKLQLPTLVLSGEEPVGDAIAAAAAQSGLPEDRFFLAAAGERAFPLLEQTNLLVGRQPLGLILLSPSGRPDRWKDLTVPPVPALVIGSVNGGAELTRSYNALSGDGIVSNGSPMRASKGSVTLITAPETVVTDALPSVSLLTSLAEWMGPAAGGSIPEIGGRIGLWRAVRTALWFTTLISLLVLLLAAALITGQGFAEGSCRIVTAQVTSRGRFYLGWVLVWLASIPAAGLSALLLWLFRIPLGAGGMLVASVLIGASCSAGLLYRFRLAPGVSGQPAAPARRLKPSRLAAGLLPAAVLFASGFVLARSGFWNARLIPGHLMPFLVLWVLFSLGFYLLSHDAMVIEMTRTSGGRQLLMLFSPFLPLLLVPVFAVPIGMIPSAFLLAKAIFAAAAALLGARVSENLTGSAALGAVSCAAPLALFFVTARML